MTILTTEPTERIESIHGRMPVILPREAEAEWLTDGPERRTQLYQPYPEDDLSAYEISTRVNNPANDDPTVIEPYEHEQSGLEEFG